MKKYLPLIPAVVVVVVITTLFVRSQRTTFITSAVTRGAITQEVLASGNVAAQSTISLQFQTIGTVRAIKVSTGDSVSAGTELAQLDSGVLSAQLAQAQAAVQTQQAQLATLVQGTRPEQLAVTDAQIAADTSAVVQAERALLNAIQSAYTQADDAVTNKTDPLLNNPHSGNPQLAFGTSNSQLGSAVLTQRLAVETHLDNWAKSFSQLTASGDLDSAARSAQASLGVINMYLADLNTLLSSAIPNQQASQTMIASWTLSLATARANINAANAALTAALSAEDAASSALTRDQRTRDLQGAGTLQTALDAQKALVAQAQANVLAIREQLAQTRIAAPVDGTITAVNADPGETVSAQTVVVTMIPNKKLQIDVNLPEDSVARVRVGDHARITLDAFAGEVRAGTVTSIDPAQTIIGGAVYYKTTVVLSDSDDRIKPGMTANVWIETGSAEDALLVPASALAGRDTNSSVQVLVNGAPVVRSVVTGLRGKDGLVEIRSGLTEGEQVVTASN